MPAPTSFIIDGDWGGDEMQLAAVALAHPASFKILGACAVFGNTALPQVTQNALDILSFLNAPSLAVYEGTAGPSGGPPLEGDDAHGANGLGGTVLPHASTKSSAQKAVSFLLETLRAQPPQSVIVTATGPLTNIAEALRKDPETMHRVKRILIMGGCTAPMPARDMATRQGNITPEAEFNFYMAAQDARAVLASALPLVLFPMNLTHQLTFTPARKEKLLQVLAADPARAALCAALIAAPQEMDQRKFGIDAVMHDVHTYLYHLIPDAYAGRRGFVAVTPQGPAQGHSSFTPDPAGSTLVIEKILSPDTVFGCVVQSLRRAVEASLKST